VVGMRERADEIGAGFEILSSAGKGTVVRVRVKVGTGERGGEERENARSVTEVGGG
jgi:hypothetical protein